MSEMEKPAGGRRRGPSNELIGILAVGVALGALMLASWLDVRSEIRHQASDLRAAIARLDDRLRDLEVRLGSLEVRFTSLEERLGDVEGRLGDVAGRLGDVEGRLGVVADVRLPGPTCCAAAPGPPGVAYPASFRYHRTPHTST